MNNKKWTPEEIAKLRALYPVKANKAIGQILGCSTLAIKNRAHKLGLQKAQGWSNDGRFQPGHKPFNTGTKGLTHGSCTSFKKGSTPHNLVPVGTIVAKKEKGRIYQEIKVCEHAWQRLNVYVWERHHGPVPAAHAVIFRDGDTLNTDIDNLECIPMSELAQRNRNSEKARKTLAHIYELERVRHLYGLPPKTKHGHRMFKPSGKHVIGINTKPLSVDL